MVFPPTVPGPSASSSPEPAPLLLYDTDLHGVSSLVSGFEKSGAQLASTSDLGAARAFIRSSGASLLLVGMHAGERASLALIRDAAALARKQNLVCLALGRPELRADSLTAGAAAFFPVPVLVGDLLTANRLLAAASRNAGKGSSTTEAEVSVSLDDVGGIYQLIRVFAAIARSAVVRCFRGTKPGELRFIGGALMSVEVPPLQGLPALHQILLWESAQLTIKFRKVAPRGRQLSLKPVEVLEECDRFLRDFAHSVAGLGDARTVFGPNSARRPAPQMPTEVIPVLKLFDGRRDLSQVLADSPFGIFDTLRIIKRFVGDEAVVPLTPIPHIGSRSATRSEGPAALDVWFQRPSADNSAMESKVQKTAASAPVAPTSTSNATATAEAATPATSTATATANLRLVPSVVVSAATVVATGGGVENETTPPPLLSADVITPPPRIVATVVAAAPAPLPGASPTAQTRPPGTVAQGEIRVPRLRVPSTGSMPVAGMPSVLVDFAHVPAATPAPTSSAPVNGVAESPRSQPHPLGSNTLRGHSARPTPNAFSDMESDFFRREADLYKPNAVESFDDLDGGAGRTRTGGGGGHSGGGSGGSAGGGGSSGRG